MRDLLGQSNERWEVIAIASGRRFVFKCKACGQERTASIQLFNKGVCSCERKKQQQEYYYNVRKQGKTRPRDKKELRADKLPLDAPTLPPRLNFKGVSLLCYTLLNHALADGKRKSNVVDAEKFVTSEWCKEICETLDIDYKSYVDKFYKNKDKIK